MLIKLLPSFSVLIASFVTMVTLIMMALKMRGGHLSKMINYVTAGIFFTVFLHAGLDLIGKHASTDEAVLLDGMGALLIIGAIFFMIGSWVGFKALK